jgi:hypothetical protein
LLPEKYRFSRGVILIGGLTALTLITLTRWILIKSRFVEDNLQANQSLQTIIVGSSEEFDHVKNLFTHAGLEERIIGRVAVSYEKTDAIGRLDELEVLIKSSQVKEVIFCKGYLSYKTIISLVQQIPHTVSVRFFSIRTESIVGSDSKNTLGEFISAHPGFSITDGYQKRMKRMIDVFVAGLLLITFPVQMIVSRINWVRRAIDVLLLRRTWVSYVHHNDHTLPALLPGVLSVTGNPTSVALPLTEEAISKLDYLYAKNYDWKQDLRIIIKGYKRFKTV